MIKKEELKYWKSLNKFTFLPAFIEKWKMLVFFCYIRKIKKNFFEVSSFFMVVERRRMHLRKASSYNCDKSDEYF